MSLISLDTKVAEKKLSLIRKFHYEILTIFLLTAIVFIVFRYIDLQNDYISNLKEDKRETKRTLDILYYTYKVKDMK